MEQTLVVFMRVQRSQEVLFLHPFGISAQAPGYLCVFFVIFYVVWKRSSILCA